MNGPARPWRRTPLGVPLWVWAVGLLGAGIVMGPALAPGSLLNLDLVLVPDPPVPRGVWALGPELPRRVPMWVPIAWLSALAGGDLVGKAVMVVGLVLAFAGMFRLVDRLLRRPTAPAIDARARGLVAAGTALLYAFGPFLVTRLAVGHLNVVWTMALLPWALPDLLVPDRSVRRLFLWCAAIGFTGSYGGTLVGLILLVSLAARRGRRAPKVLAALALAQVPWLVPLAIVGAGGTAMVDAASFPSSGTGLAGIGQLLAGHGFWNFPLQVGWPGGWPVAVLGFVLLGLAVVGAWELPAAWRVPLTALAAIGFVAAASSGVPGLDGLVVRLSRTPLGAPFRETQRLLPLYLVWLVPSVALGTARAAASVTGPALRSTPAQRADEAVAPAVEAAGERAVRTANPRSTWAVGLAVAAAPLVVALVLAAPGRWGAGGQLRPTTFPPAWSEARSVVERDPGPLVAFPWYQYFTFDVADNRLVLNTVPLYFGGDVLASSDPNISSRTDGVVPARERGDPREARVRLLANQVQVGRAISTDLLDLGVRWLVLVKDVDFARYEGGLNGDPGLERVLDAKELALYRVRQWAGAAIDEQGHAVPASPIIAPLSGLDPSGPARVAIPGTGGWRRGTDAATPTPDGLLAVPAGSGWLWYWPAVPAVLADLVWLGLVAGATISLRRRPPATDDEPVAARSISGA